MSFCTHFIAPKGTAFNPQPRPTRPCYQLGVGKLIITSVEEGRSLRGNFLLLLHNVFSETRKSKHAVLPTIRTALKSSTAICAQCSSSTNCRTEWNRTELWFEEQRKSNTNGRSRTIRRETRILTNLIFEKNIFQM